MGTSSSGTAINMYDFMCSFITFRCPRTGAWNLHSAMCSQWICQSRFFSSNRLVFLLNVWLSYDKQMNVLSLAGPSPGTWFWESAAQWFLDWFEVWTAAAVLYYPIIFGFEYMNEWVGECLMSVSVVCRWKLLTDNSVRY